MAYTREQEMNVDLIQFLLFLCIYQKHSNNSMHMQNNKNTNNKNVIQLQQELVIKQFSKALRQLMAVMYFILHNMAARIFHNSRLRLCSVALTARLIALSVRVSGRKTEFYYFKFVMLIQASFVILAG